MCHIILFLPILALSLFNFFPLRTALMIYLVVLLLTWFIYYKMVIAMQAKVRTGKEGMIGEEALVLEDIDPEGRVMVWSEVWTATGHGKKFHKGEKVVIEGFEGLSVVVGESPI